MNPGSLTIARARSFALWALMRLLPYPRLREWHDAGRLRLIEPLLLRGQLSVRGGLATRAWLSARHFEPWSAQGYLFLTGTHEPQVQEALRRTVPRGGVVYDIGANVGFETLIAARLTGPEGRVVAFDPQRECAEAVAVNAALNGFRHVEVRCAAVGRATGRSELVVVDDSLWTRLAEVGEHERQSRRETVEVMALDDAVASGELPPPDVVKIDVEGAELDVVAGMRGVLADHRPALIVEMHGKNAGFCDAMAAAGYRVVNLDGPEPVAQADGNVHAYCEPL